METVLIVISYFGFVFLWNWWGPPLSEVVKRVVRGAIVIIGLPIIFITYKGLFTLLSGYVGLSVEDLAIMAYIGFGAMFALMLGTGDLQFKGNQNLQ